jgi:cytochrome c-type biogenesis protein CcmF
MIGQLLIHLLFGLAVGSTVAYGLSTRSGRASFLSVGRILFGLMTALLIVAASMLVIDIVQHRFEYTYVWNYSSRELPLHLLIATFYSGQEGSFLLWTMLVAIIGVVLAPYARRHGYESAVMTMYGLILCFLTLLLVAKNPFAFYYETFAADGVTAADVPLNGKGLNPLLHNSWITIHPPILFTGFASMSVSFAFAMAGLWKRDYHRWIRVALPWTLFATAILGFGIMLGGFWAYETLGWGGFWGWDPVENSSLIPWLVSVALVHTMLVQQRTRGLVKTNMALAVAAFVMVLYSTFLTRSGILGDTSVHSFVDPGAFAFWILLAFMLSFVIMGATMLVKRAGDMNIHREDFQPSTREFMMAIGAALVMASAIFVTVGTTWPVFMEIIDQPKVAVNVGYYNTTHIVLVPLILLVNALSLLMQWRSTTRSVFKKNVLISAAIAIVLTSVSIALGVQSATAIALATAAWFALIVNVRAGWTIVRRSAASAGAYISHTGIALLIFGVITTSQYSENHHVVLTQGEPTQVGDYTLTFLGKEQIEKHFADREKFRYDVHVGGKGEDRVVSAVLYWSDYNKRQSAFLEPGIRWGAMNDLYISPKATEMENVWNASTLMKGATMSVPRDTTVRIALERFTMPMEEGPTDDGRMQMSAVLHVDGPEGHQEVRARTKITTSEGTPEFDPVWTAIPGSVMEVGLTQITRNNDDPSKSTAQLSFREAGKPLPTPREVFTVDFSVKPLISLVWIGVITMVMGFAFSIVRYSRQMRNEKVATDERIDAPSDRVVTSVE